MKNNDIFWVISWGVLILAVFITMGCPAICFVTIPICVLDLIFMVSWSVSGTEQSEYTLRDFHNDMKSEAPNMYGIFEHNYYHSIPKMHVDVHQDPQPDHWLTHFTGELIRDTTGFDLFTGEYHG